MGGAAADQGGRGGENPHGQQPRKHKQAHTRGGGLGQSTEGMA